MVLEFRRLRRAGHLGTDFDGNRWLVIYVRTWALRVQYWWDLGRRNWPLDPGVQGKPSLKFTRRKLNWWWSLLFFSYWWRRSNWTCLNGWRWSVWRCSVGAWTLKFLLVWLTYKFIFFVFFRNSKFTVFISLFLVNLMLLRSFNHGFILTITREINHDIFCLLNFVHAPLSFIIFYFPWKFSWDLDRFFTATDSNTIFFRIPHFSLVKVHHNIAFTKTVFVIVALNWLFRYLLFLNMLWCLHFLFKAGWSYLREMVLRRQLVHLRFYQTLYWRVFNREL